MAEWISHDGRGANKPACKVFAVMFRNRRVSRRSNSAFKHGGIWDWSFREPKPMDIIAYKTVCPSNGPTDEAAQ